jgi:hypothetical protein
MSDVIILPCEKHAKNRNLMHAYTCLEVKEFNGDPDRFVRIQKHWGRECKECDTEAEPQSPVSEQGDEWYVRETEVEGESQLEVYGLV